MATSLVRRKWLWNAILLVVLCFALLGIYFGVMGGPRSQEEEQIQAALSTRLSLSDDPIDLNALIPGAHWKRICAIESYFSVDDFSSAVGRPVEQHRAFRWRNREEVWTLLFVGEEAEGLVAVRMPRKDVGDLLQKTMVRCIDDLAVLVIDRRSDKQYPDVRLESSHKFLKGD